MEHVEYITRSIEEGLKKDIKNGQSILLLGPRQTGKTTLVRKFKNDMKLDFLDPETRQRYEKETSAFIKEVKLLSKKCKHKPLIILDEIQKVPALMDSIQSLIDSDIATFLLLGSSARKLKRGTEINLLPGRVLAYRLDPFTCREIPLRALEQFLLNGSLPRLALMNSEHEIERQLEYYVSSYLEEEVRGEAIVRNLPAFAKFLELAAAESGQIANFRKLSRTIGVSHTTIQSYYQILEDCLITERVDAFSKSKTRHKLTKSPKYLFFDPGVRRVAANEGRKPTLNRYGELFEQYIGLELIRATRLNIGSASVFFWRDPDGPEVDYVVKIGDDLIPIEVKWNDTPSEKDTRHIKVFLREYEEAKKGVIICQTPRAYEISKDITALPWREAGEVFTG